MPESHLVLFANEAFYAAFAARDVEAMDDVWSRRETITCIHPGSSPIFGHKRVQRSWRMILNNPQSPAVVCRDAAAQMCGDVAYVLCWEQIEHTFLAATNVFVREDGRWRMVHHQAAAAPPPENPSEKPAVVMQ